MLFNNASKTIDGIDTKLDKNKLHSREIEMKNFETELKLKEDAIAQSESVIIESLQAIYKSFKTGIKYQSDMGNIINKNARTEQISNEEKSL